MRQVLSYCKSVLIIKYLKEGKKRMKSNSIINRLDLENLMHSLKELHEEQDQSREEPFQLNFGDSDSVSSLANSHSQWVDGALTDICRKETHSQWSYVESEGHELRKLQDINAKLLQDNHVLIKQCVRLRILLKQPKPAPIIASSTKTLQLRILQLQNQLTIQKQENLSQKLHKNFQLLPSYPMIMEELHQLQDRTQMIIRKLDELAKQKQKEKEGEKKTILYHSSTTNTSKGDKGEESAVGDRLKPITLQLDRYATNVRGRTVGTGGVMGVGMGVVASGDRFWGWGQ